MLPLNTMQPVVRDTIPPTFSNDELVSAEVKYGTNVFVSGLKALDEGRDISRDIQYSFEGLPNTFVEGGSLNVLFYLYDGGANYIEQTVTVPIVGGPKYPTPVLFDFEQATEIPEEFTQTNGEWAITESGLQCIGSEPASPRWNIVLDTDAEADIQIEFVPMEAGRVHGVIVRGQNLDDMFYAWYRDGIFTVSDRNTGVTGSYDLYMDETLEVTDTISLGARVEEDTLSFYHGSEKVLEHTDPRLRYARQFGIISSSDQAVYKKLMVGNLNTITFGDYEMPALTPPVITLEGGDVALNVGEVFQEPGYKAYDNQGNEITLNVVVTGSTETTFPRVGTLEYNVTANGITAETQTRIFTVTAESELLEEVSKQRFVLKDNKVLNGFAGRSNLEKVQFKPSSTNPAIALDKQGFYDFEENETQVVEVITPSGLISSVNGDVEWEGSELYIRTGAFSSIKKHESARVVVYLANDTRGVVFAGPGLDANLIIHFN